MNLGFLLLADYSEAINGKIYAMGGGWNVSRFPRLPHSGVRAPRSASMFPGTRPTRLVLSMHVEDPDEAGRTSSRWTSRRSRPPGSIQGSDQRIVVSLQTRATFSAAGPACRRHQDRGRRDRPQPLLRGPGAAANGAPPQTLSPEDQPPDPGRFRRTPGRSRRVFASSGVIAKEALSRPEESLDRDQPQPVVLGGSGDGLPGAGAAAWLPLRM